MCKATKEERDYYYSKRCEVQNDANDKKTSFGIPDPINNPPNPCRHAEKKCYSFRTTHHHSEPKHLKKVTFFLTYKINENSPALNLNEIF